MLEDDEYVTEEQWEHFRGYPTELIDSIPEELRTDRKLVLYVCACCQRVRHLFPSDDLRAVIDWAEEQADHLGEVKSTDTTGKHILYHNQIESLVYRQPEDTAAFSVAWAARCLSVMVWVDNDDGMHEGIPDLIEKAVWLNSYAKPAKYQVPYMELPPLVQVERNIQCDLLRDIFGNPFRPVSFCPSWRTDTVLALAHQMYESREFSAMPILADALQDAGCDNEDILAHCRDTAQVHVRGCWVCDLVLGKT